MRLLITGWQGQVARSLAEAATARADVEALAIGRPALDLVKLPTILRTLADARPDVVINTAAYTAVDKAESEADAAFGLNRDGARLLAEATAERGLPLIHLSTDYVYDGRKSTPYVETDAPSPANVYGRSKLAGEEAVIAVNPKHVVLRTAWVVSPFGQNFVKTMLRLAGERRDIKVVDDQVGSLTYAPHLAAGILEIARQLALDPQRDDRFGVYHAAGSGFASWYEVARSVFEVSAAAGGAAADVQPIPSASYPTAAARPANSRLDTAKIAAAYGIRLPDWRTGIDACVRRLLAGT